MTMEVVMARTLDEVIAALPKGERDKIEARARELIAEEMSLQQLRKAMHKTQVAVAKQLKVGQETVSKIETRTDLLLSTLRGYVQAIGGELELVATFKDRPPVRLEELGRITPARRKRERHIAA
jgi:hypothetical protein